ncbi:MAG: Rid family detoxifying hydrolase [Acidimicrobiales bacterium]
MRSAVSPDDAVTVGPYSAAIASGGILYCSGQTPVDPETGKLVAGGIDAQTRQCFANLFSVLQAAGLGPDDVITVSVYLTDMNDFAEMNAAYAEQFTEPFPARTTIGVAALPLGADVEIKLMAELG